MQSAVLACAAPGGVGLDGGGGGGDVVMVKRSSLAACLTCPQCGRLFRDAATISECLHTFCRKCVSKEFINKEFCCCPTCNIDLGCASLEKLRVDHSVQYVRSKIFPFKRQEVEDPEVIPPVASPVKRKERSLSSLTIHAPRVSIQKCLRRGEQKLHSYAALLWYGPFLISTIVEALVYSPTAEGASRGSHPRLPATSSVPRLQQSGCNASTSPARPRELLVLRS